MAGAVVRSNSTPRWLALLLVTVAIDGCLIDTKDYPLESSSHDSSDAGASSLVGGPVVSGESGAAGESSDAGSGGIGQGGDDSTATGDSGANTATGGVSPTGGTASTMSSGGVGKAGSTSVGGTSAGGVGAGAGAPNGGAPNGGAPGAGAGGAPDSGECGPAFATSACLDLTVGTKVSWGGHNYTCSDDNCRNCEDTPACAPSMSGCPFGAVWTDNGSCS